ncbi:endo-1,4-beta-xylanase [Sphingomonas sp. CBMAI 2297]|uniref:endo-1,4-beta-xylanase n=1 Tax=Sphingomonas sp. CBMAI 2297 TaxID=2991720 RepID=UPI002453D07D|nr:endo-1,4-beta-xylanase [Sphingomonas sp. CBMAI 2297]MDH4743569.1 endo-1,4-beta-xylanase [Sphingomonas sp. CBMAI 2297]
MIELTRRGLLGAGAALALPFPAVAQAAEGLNAVAKTRGMRFGSCSSWSPPGADRGSFANPRYAELLKRDCGILVPENEFKWQAVRPDAKTFDLDHFSDMLDYAEANGMAMRGHTLLWHKTQYFPKWLNDHDFGATPAKEAERILGTHIRTLCKLYANRVVSFDVVNETVEEGTGALRTSSLSRAFGGTEAMLDFAYHTAREHAPGVELVYNDYMSWEPGNEGHRTGVLKLLEGFRKRGVPCDTLGVQSHIGLTGGATVGALVSRQEKPWRGFLDNAVGMGYKLAVTEFDVNDKALPTDAKVRDGIIANYAAAYLEIMFSYPQLRDVLAWGMCDRFTWLNGFTPRRDGTRQRATPYDAEYQPKALYGAIRDAFAGAAAR